MLDATTAIEDKDFWVNPGFDPIGIVSAGLDTLSGRPRGASTITQQLVRDRLLTEEVMAGDTYERKVKEIIQSIRLTEAYPGVEGKQEIITAYLNNNFYGNNSYGVKAAASGYFGKALDKLTLAEYAVLAGIPQSPTKFDLMRNAEEICLDKKVKEDDECQDIQLAGPGHRRDRRAPQLHPRPDEVAQPAHGRPAHAGRVRGGQAGAGHHQAAGLGQVASPALRVAGPQ